MRDPFRSRADRNIFLIQCHTVSMNLVFILPTIVPYYRHIGLSFRDFLISESVFSAVVLFAEIPTGWISDVSKRKTVLQMGIVAAIAGYAGLIMSSTLWHAAVSQGIIGLAVALNSGSVSALLYDSLLEEGCEQEYRKHEGKRHAIGLYCVAISAIAGAYIYTVNVRLPLAADIGTMLLGMIAVAFMHEPSRHQRSVEKHPVRDMLETARYALHGHKEISGIILISTVIFCATKLMLWCQQPYYQATGMPIEWFGYILAASYLLGGLAGHWSHTIEHWGSNRTALAAMAAALALACFLLALAPSATMALPLFFVGTLIYGIGQPRVNNAINSRVGSERRATILSTASLMVHILFIPTSLMIGFLSDEGSVRDSLLWIAGQIAVLGGIGLLLWKKPSVSTAVS